MTISTGGDDSLPRLGPRVWWVYLALDGPRTSTDLSVAAGISEGSIRKHLRTLERNGLARQIDEPGAAPVWVRDRRLDPATVYQLLGRVERRHLKQPDDTGPDRPGWLAELLARVTGG